MEEKKKPLNIIKYVSYIGILSLVLSTIISLLPIFNQSFRNGIFTVGLISFVVLVGMASVNYKSTNKNSTFFDFIKYIFNIKNK